MRNSLEELCITRVAAVNSFARVLNPLGGYPYLSLTDVKGSISFL